MKMKIEIGNLKKSVVETPLKSENLNMAAAEQVEESLFIPYMDKQLLENDEISFLLADTAEQTDWVHYDEDLTKAYLVFNTEDRSTYLHIEIAPPKYTELQKERILENETDEEMLETWQSIFCYADDFHSGAGGRENYVDIEIELEDKEIEKLKNVL